MSIESNLPKVIKDNYGIIVHQIVPILDRGMVNADNNLYNRTRSAQTVL